MVLCSFRSRRNFKVCIWSPNPLSIYMFSFQSVLNYLCLVCLEVDAIIICDMWCDPIIENVFHIVTKWKSWELPYSFFFCLTASLEHAINFFCIQFWNAQTFMKTPPFCWAHRIYNLFSWSLKQCHMQLQLSICYSLHDYRIAFWTRTHTHAGKACDSK